MQVRLTLMMPSYTIVNSFVLVSYLRVDKSKIVEIYSDDFYKQRDVLVFLCRSLTHFELTFGCGTEVEAHIHDSAPSISVAQQHLLEMLSYLTGWSL